LIAIELNYAKGYNIFLLGVSMVKISDSVPRASETIYRTIFNAANDAIFIHDRDTGGVIDFNQKASQMYGYTHEEIRELQVEVLSAGVSPYTRREALSWLKKALGGKPQLFEWLAKHKTGRLFWVEVNLKHAVIGGRDCLLAMVRDISERKRVEKKAHKVQQRYSELVNNLTVCVFRTTPGSQGRFVEVNSAMVTTFEADSKEELLNHNVWEIYQDPSKRKEFSDKMFQRGFLVNEEEQLKTLKGRLFWASVTAVMKKNEMGEVYFDGIIEDISERKQMGQELSKKMDEVEKFYKVAVGREDRILELKRQVAEFAKSENTPPPNMKPDLSSFSGSDDFAEQQDIFSEQEEKIGELTRTKEQILSILSDVTEARNEAKKKADEVAKLYEDLKVVDRIKTELLAVISHELRTPLTPVQGYTKLLLAGQVGEITPKQKRVISTIQKQAKHLLTLIDSILDVSGLTYGKFQEPEKEPIFLEAMLKDLLDVMSEGREDKEIGVEVDLSKGFPVLQADRIMLWRLFTNLIGNAFKFTQRGGCVRINAMKEESFVKIEVIDNGVGIAKEDLGKLFEKFYQVDGSYTRSVGGIGLGLAVAKGIVEAHGGKIWAESDGLEKGSKFCFTIPISFHLPAQSETEWSEY